MPAVELEHDGPVAIVRLTRPDVLNAMNPALLEELVTALRSAMQARVVILEGEGRAFCVGEDLNESLGAGADELRESFDRLQDLTRLLTQGPAVAIAAVHGYAIGGGAELALAADLIVLQEQTRLRFPEVSLGHAVTGGISARLVAAIGLIRAKELLLTSRWVEAEEALRIGLVNAVVPDAGAGARELAQQLAAHPPRSLRATKTGLERAALPHQEVVLAAEVDAALHCFADPAATASLDAFRNR
ncbi:MAG TPA: enoyl-CoA hydratase/isomerase family protein [Solirubrobacter sp.]